MKPCYIKAKEGMRIDLDGPALSVSSPSRAPTLAPLSRISRIVISGTPQCSTPALLACAERGIAVTFLQRDGAIKAHLFGRSRTGNDLFFHMRHLLDLPDWPERYQIWLNAAASRARLALCRRLNFQPDKLPLDQICAVLNQRIEQFVNKNQRNYLQQRLQGLCSNLVNENLIQAGLNAEYSRYIEQRLDIPSDFAYLLSLSLQLPLIEWLSRQCKQRSIDDRDIVALFEKNSPRLERIARSLISRLHSFLIDLV